MQPDGGGALLVDRNVQSDPDMPIKRRRRRCRACATHAVAVLLGAIMGAGFTIGAFFAGFLYSRQPAVGPPPAACAACSDPARLDGNFTGNGSMVMGVSGVSLTFGWLVQYSFDSQNGTMDARMTPLDNPWPHPLHAFHCSGVPFMLNTSTCLVTADDACMKAAEHMGQAASTHKRVIWDGDRIMTLIQVQHGFFGDHTTTTVLRHEGPDLS